MDQKKFEVLKKIQEFRDKNTSPDYESLGKWGFEASLLRAMIDEGLIRWGGVFSLTENGEKAHRDYLIIESSKSKIKQKFLLDSNVFDRVVSGEIDLNRLVEFKQNAEFYITHVQVDEINECPDKEKRGNLSLIKSKINPIIIPTTSFVPGISRLGEARLSDGGTLEELRKGNFNHSEDALIGETAIKENLILVTDDNTLKNRVISEGGKALSIEEFKRVAIS